MTEHILKSFPVKQPVSGSLTIPGDKSISHRSIIISSLSSGQCTISNFLMSQDCLNTLKAFRQLGVPIEQTGDSQFVVQGQGLHGLKEANNIIDVGNSGTGMRLIAGVLAAQSFVSVLSGDSSLHKRPMQRIITPLEMMGAQIAATNGQYPPLTITGGHLRPIEYKLPMASAQVKSCILLAGLAIDGTTRVIEPAKSRDHTEHMLAYFGADISVDDLTITLCGGKDLTAKDIVVPGDISSAAFFIVAAAAMPGAKLRLINIGLNPTRCGIITILRKMGANITIEYPEDTTSSSGWNEPRGDIIIEGTNLNGITIAGDDIPLVIDEIPILCVAAACAQGTTKIRDAAELRVKESDRISTMATNLQKIGVRVTEYEDGMDIEGGASLKPAQVESYDDHRIAMSMAIAGLFLSSGEIGINDTKNIDTSFPNFEQLLSQLRAL